MIKSNKETLPGTFSERIINLSICILLTFVFFIGFFLFYFSTRFSYYSPTEYDIPFYLIKDNTFLNILTIVATVLLSLILNKLFDKLESNQRTAGYIFLGISCLIYITACLIWTSVLPYYPSGDQLNATAAAHYHLDGNFIMLEKGGYLGKFPYQKGLTFFYEILFSIFGDFCYPIAAKFHIGLGVITLITGYLFVEETSWNSICKILYCPLFLLCAPYIIMTPYTYGDLPSICFCTVLFWALLRFSRTGKWRYIAISCCCATLSLMVRVHTWIVLIAILIGLLLVAIQKKKLAPFLAGLLIVSSSYGATRVLEYSYYLRSGYSVNEGAPMVLTLAMGMQDSYLGPGTYNNYQTLTLSSVNLDNEAAADIAWDNLKENLTNYIEDPSYGYWFFKTKLLLQWIEPSFESLYSTESFDDDLPLPQVIEDIYYGSLHDKIIHFTDRYQSVIYFGFLCFVPVLFKKRKENPALHIPLIAIVGGFLFSIIWEAKARYVLPYYIFMLVYVPDGLWQISAWLKTLWCRSIPIRLPLTKKEPQNMTDANL